MEVRAQQPLKMFNNRDERREIDDTCITINGAVSEGASERARALARKNVPWRRWWRRRWWWWRPKFSHLQRQLESVYALGYWMAGRGRASIWHYAVAKSLFSSYLFMPSAISYRLRNKRISALYFIDLKLMVKNFLMNISSSFVRWSVCDAWTRTGRSPRFVLFMPFHSHRTLHWQSVTFRFSCCRCQSDVNKLNYFADLATWAVGSHACMRMCVLVYDAVRTHRWHYSFCSYSADYE